MNKLLKKLLPVALALVLCLAMGLTAFAESAPEETPGATETAATPEGGDSVAGPPVAGAGEETVAATVTDVEIKNDDGASIVVSTYGELKAALSENNGYTTIYLGAHITADGTGITVDTSKTDVVIDGSPPSGGRYSFTQSAANTGSDAATIRVTSGAIRSVTLRNMDITGRNAYGVVWVPEATKNVILIHENVTYTGPQAFHNRGGAVQAANSAYTLQNALGELAEAAHAEFSGAVTVEAPSNTDAILWLTTSASTLTLRAGARVDINTKSYLIYTGGYVPDVTFEAGASLSLASATYGFTFGDHRVGSFLMAEGASLSINLNTTLSYAALRVNKLFQMDPGSSATIVRTGTAGIPLRLTAAGAKAVFNQPERVFLYSSAGVPLRFTGAGGTLSITTSALNAWQSAAWPLSGGTGALPSHIWNKAGDGLLTLNGTYNEAANQSLTHNLTSDDPATGELNKDTFNLEKSQLVAFGSLALSIDTPTSESTSLTGGTAPGADLLAAYILADGRGGQISGAADSSGGWALPVAEGPLEAGSTVSVTAVADRLAMRQNATVQDAADHRLSFLSVPATLQFGSVPVPGAATLVGRQDIEFFLSVADTRPLPSPWRVDASITGPLSASVQGGKSELANAVVFRDKNSAPTALNDKPMTVYRQTGGAAGQTDISWAGGEGILLSLSPGQAYSGVAYTTTIHWELVDAP